jgi:hypothetical protein
MAAVLERKDGTHILCSTRPRRRTSRRKVMIIQFFLGAACLTIGVWLLVT